MKELGKLRPLVAIGLLIGGFFWHTAWWILGGLIFIDWSSDRWRELLDAIRGKPEPRSSANSVVNDTLKNSYCETKEPPKNPHYDDEDWIELWDEVPREVQDKFRARWQAEAYENFNADWTELWDAAPEKARDKIRVRWKTQQEKFGISAER